MKLQIIETEQYILAVSDEEPTDGNITLHPNGTVGILTTALAIALFKETNKGSYVEDCKKIIAHLPKGDAKELDLPLLPSIDMCCKGHYRWLEDTDKLWEKHEKPILICCDCGKEIPDRAVEDDVEKLAIEFANLNKSKFNNWYGCHDGFIAGYKAATKVYSEEDLIRAIAMAKMAKTHDGLIDMDAWISNGYEGATPAYTEDEIIQSLKQPKMPLWFVAEFKGPKMIYSEKYETMMHNPECYKLKTATINGKTYLVGHYE